MQTFLDNWKTTAAGLAVIVVWALKELVGCNISSEVAIAITTVISGLGLMFARDAKRGGGRDGRVDSSSNNQADRSS